MDTKSFAEKIRTKYPGSYDQVDDYTLTQKIVEKYPSYKEQITDFGTTSPTPLRDRLAKQNIQTSANMAAGRENLVDVGKGFVKGAMQTATGLTDVLGSVKKGVKDYAIELGGAMKGATPEEIQQYKTDIAETETTPMQPLVEKQREMSVPRNTAQEVGSLIEQGVEFAIPQAAGAKLAKVAGLGSKGTMATQMGVDLAGGYGLGKLHGMDDTEAGISGALNAALPPILKGAGALIKYATRPATEAFKETFKKAFPTMAKDIKGNLDKKIASGFSVVDDIVKNNETIGLTDEATGAIRDPKTYSYSDVNEIFNKRMPEIYKDYTASLSQVDKDAFANAIQTQISTKLDDLANALSKENVQSKQKAISQKIREIQGLRDTSPEGIQNYIEGLNQEAKWVPGSPLTMKQIQAANVAGDFRKILDESIDKVGDIGGYQEARNLYGSYRQIKDQLAVLAARELRSTPGLVDRITNMGITATGLEALLSANPKGLLLALGVKAGSKLWKSFGSPERSLNKLFKIVEKEGASLNQNSLKKAANIQPNTTANINAPINNISESIAQSTKAATKNVENLQYLDNLSKQGEEVLQIPYEVMQEKLDDLTRQIGERKLSKEFNQQAYEQLKDSFAGGGFNFKTYATMRNAGVRDLESLDKAGLGDAGKGVLRQLEDYAGSRDISEMIDQADEIIALGKKVRESSGVKELLAQKKMLVSDEMYNNAKKNFKENMGRINSGIPVDQIKDLTVMAAYHIEKGIRSATELGTQLAKEGYKLTKEQVEKLYNGVSKSTISKELQPLAEEAKKYKSAEEFVKDIKNVNLSNEQKQNLVTSINKKIEDTEKNFVSNSQTKDTFYHGTLSKFDNFEKKTGLRGGALANIERPQQGFFFTSDRGTAKSYIDFWRDAGKKVEDPRVIDVKLKTTQPLDLSQDLPKDIKQKAVEIFSKYDIPSTKLKSGKIQGSTYEYLTDNKEFIDYLKSKGFDSIKRSQDEFKTGTKKTEIMVFEPDQILQVDKNKMFKQQLIDLWNKANGKN